MSIDLVGWEDAVSGAEDLIGADDEIVGADDDLRQLLAVSGADDELAISGARVRRRAAVRRGMRRFPLGFVSSEEVPAGKSADVTVQPQLTFRGERLIVPTGIAEFFDILDLRVGNRSQFVASAPVPSKIFSELGYGVALRMDTAKVSQDIRLTVLNVDTVDHFFRAAILGTAVY